MRCIVRLILCGIAMAVCRQALYADSLTFNIVPVAVPGSTSTTAIGINDAGQIVGSYVGSGGSHGFLDVGGVFTNIDVPGSASTQATGINNLGQIVGFYTDVSGASHVFLDTNGTFQTLDIPAATFIKAVGLPGQVAINDLGQIVGTTSDAHAFLYSNGQITFLPGFFAGGGLSTANGINDAGAIVGSVALSGWAGYVYQNGVYSQFVGGDEGATYGINNRGDFVYNFGGFTGFPEVTVVIDDVFTNLPSWPPGSEFFTGFARGFNGSDQVVGTYPRDNGAQSFLATPTPEPGTLTFTVFALAGIVFARRFGTRRGR